jgi:hypothetical protein
MSHIRFKLESAKYFLEQMIANIEIPKIFAFNLSAFLSEARSVTLVMQSEFRSYSGFAKWYKTKQEEMRKDDVLKIFNDLRVTTVHRRPVLPPWKLRFGIIEPIEVSDSPVEVHFTIKEGKNGKLSVENVFKKEKDKPPSETEVTLRHSWYFEERPNDDPLQLCVGYLTKLENLVEECERLFF